MKRLVPVSVFVALSAAACGGDAPSSPDGRTTDAAPDAGPPHGAVRFGTLDRCNLGPLLVANGFVYWMSGHTGGGISRSPIGSFAPEVLYDDPAFQPAYRPPQTFRDAVVWSTGNWPVELDPETHEVHPLVHQAVTGMAVVDGYRIFVSRRGATGDEIDELDADGTLVPVVPPGTAGTIGSMVAGPQQLLWLEHSQFGDSTRSLDVISGQIGGTGVALDKAVATHSTSTAFYAVVPGAGSSDHDLVGFFGDSVQATAPSGAGYRIAGGGEAPLYLGVGTVLTRVEHDPSTDAIVFAPVDGLSLDGLGSDHDVVFATSCDGSSATLARLYP